MFTHILPRGENPLGTGVNATLKKKKKVRENVTYKGIEVDSKEKNKENLNMWLVFIWPLFGVMLVLNQFFFRDVTSTIFLQ